jgi:hypothetical protein
MITPLFRMLLGAVVGLVGLVAMTRLVGAGFPGSMVVAEVFVGLAMVPWVVYAAWRCRHGNLNFRTSIPVALFALAGLAVVWWRTVGPVLALICSLAAFVIIWLHDLPPRRQPADRLVRIDELNDSGS